MTFADQLDRPAGQALPAPLTPADCDLQGLRFMPLDIARVLDSDLFALASGDEFKAAFALWGKSWTQVPAASLPDNDRVLESLSGAGARWRKVKAMALHGWIKCSDGRLYHPVVAEKALEAWDRREDFQEAKEGRESRQKRWRERVKALSAKLREAGITPPRGASLADLEALVERLHVDAVVDVRASTETSTGDAVEIGKTGTGTGTDSSEDKSSALDSVEIDPDREAWGSAIRLLKARANMPESRARPLFGGLLARFKLQARDLLPAISSAMANETRDPQSYLTKAAEQIQKRRQPAGPQKQLGFV